MTGETKYYRIPLISKKDSSLGWRFYKKYRDGKLVKMGIKNTDMSLEEAFSRLETKRLRRTK